MEFTKENLESLKLINFHNLNTDILNYTIKLLKEINFNNVEKIDSIIEVQKDIKNEFVYYKLSAKQCVPIEITLHDNYIDMKVGNVQSILEMHKIKENNIDNVLGFLKKWLAYDIVNEIKYSDSSKLIKYSKFYNKSNPSEIIFKDISIFSFLSVSNRERREYKSWMK